MSDVNIQLQKSSGGFSPGEKIVGDVTWNGLDPKTTAIEINLLWFTQGKGDRDHEIFANQVVKSPSDTGSQAFEFVAPSFPFSFSGKLISLIWSIEVVVLPMLEATTCELVISATGTELQVGHYESSGSQK